MRSTVTVLLLLTTFHAVCGQLNYEGNPLTEDTVYTAEESHFAEKTAKPRSLEIPETEDSYLLAAKSLQAERYQGSYDETKHGVRLSSSNHVSSPGSSSVNSYKTIPDDIPKETPVEIPVPTNNPVSGTQITETQHQNGIETRDQTYAVSAETPDPQFSTPSDSALSMFLNSKTPQESQMALEEYLTSGQRVVAEATNDPPMVYQPHISDIVLPQQQLTDADQRNQIGQQDARYSQYAHPEYFDSKSPQSIGASLPTSQQSRNFDHANRRVNVMGSREGPVFVRGPPPMYGRRSTAARPPYSGVYAAQSRVGSVPGYRRVSHGPFGPGGGGPEIIYTKPPGYGSKYYGGGGPYRYEDASAWFPDADYPPPDLNVYHSQLYAQSYDPHYYKYIAKYGKIKPHLYGKFHKKEESFLAEVFRSFKKHGLKHVMNPMFLLGLGIPMVTLMLSAMVNSRSLARSSPGVWSDIHVTDEDIDEWTTKLEKALECQANSASESERKNCSAVLE